MTVSLLPGLQESRNSGVDVRLYCQGNDPVLRTAQGSLGFRGRYNAPNGDACVTAVSTSRNLGSPSGTFTLNIKAPSDMGETHASFLRRVMDDDWVDIAYTVNGQLFHDLRGQVDTVKETRSTTGDGASSRSYVLAGRSFGSIFEKTPLWFNRHKDLPAYLYALKLLQGRNVAGTPDAAVKKLLLGFMEIVRGNQKTDWIMPRTMPPPRNATPMAPGEEASFAGQVVFDASGFEQTPERTAASPQLMDPTGKSVWALAQEWSDPTFCELFTELVAPTKDENSPFGFADTEMRVIFRTRPFAERSSAAGDARWRALPMTVVPPQWVSSRDIGRGGTERYNAFCVSPQVLSTMNKLDLAAPLWDEEDIRRHGLRLFYVESKYVAKNNDLVTLTQQAREQVRDWYAINPYLFNGSVQLGALAPGIRLGTRFRIAGGRETQQETYYVEQITNTWSLNSGGRTTLGVTRGWVGTDASYQATVDALAARYTSGAAGVPPVSSNSNSREEGDRLLEIAAGMETER